MLKRKTFALSFILAVIGIFIIANFTIASESELSHQSFWKNFKNSIHRLFIMRPLSEFEFEAQIAEEQAVAIQDLVKKGKLNEKDIESYGKQLGRVESILEELSSLNSGLYNWALGSFLNQYKSILKSSFRLSAFLEENFVSVISKFSKIESDNFTLLANSALNGDSPTDELFNAIIINRVAPAVQKELLPDLANLKQERLLRFWILAKDLDPESLKNQLLKRGQVNPVEWLRIIDEVREGLSEDSDRSALAVARQALFELLFASVDKNEANNNLELALDINQTPTLLIKSKEYKNTEQVKELAERSDFNLEQAVALERLGNYGASLSQAILASALSEIAMQKIYLSTLDFKKELKKMRQRFDDILADKKELFPEQARLLENLLVSKDFEKRFTDVQKLLIEFELSKVE